MDAVIFLTIVFWVTGCLFAVGAMLADVQVIAKSKTHLVLLLVSTLVIWPVSLGAAWLNLGRSK